MNVTAPKSASQGFIWRAENESDLREGIEAALDYRGDVTLLLKSGARIEGYLFDRRSHSGLDESQVRLIPFAGTRTIHGFRGETEGRL